MGGEATFKPSKGVITDIISSGNLNLIRNQKLRQNLASFESTLDFLKLHENGIRSSKNEMKKQLKDQGSIRKVLKHRGLNFDSKSISDTLSNKQMFVFVEFENIILDYYLQIKSANGPRFYGGIKEQIELILDEVDSEIKK
ncbi:MAG: hypothetical protein QNK20_14160 [Aureibaculum sp.]|nr:hypothetical protein [Aureibaculum sp.]